MELEGRKNTMKRGISWHYPAIALLCLGAAMLLISMSAHAHGDKHKKASDAHMQTMLQVKEQIPEEYRVMDRTPVSPTSQSLARGQELYARDCAVCHGQGGKGDGPAAAAMDPRPASFLDLEHSAIYGPGEKYWLIGNGSGETGMPAFDKLGPAERWDIVNFILSLQEKAPKKGHGH
jgi:mono/diheme cytochrome c family protein